jgi:IclR family acetate operon transcriptional repressor
MRTFTEVGRRADTHSTGVGKALLAQLPEGEARQLAISSGLPRKTPNTIVDVDDLMDELARVRRRGFAMDAGEEEIGAQCVAVAVPSSSFHAALSVSGPEARMKMLDISFLTGLLHDAADRFASELGEDAAKREQSVAGG